MKTKTFVVFLLAAILALSPLVAGVVFQVETTYHSDSGSGRTESSVMSAEGRNLKMEIAPRESGGGKSDAIYRGERREMVVVDHDDKSYYVMDEQTMQELAGMVGGVMDQMHEALKGVPESERRKIEEMMKQRMPTPTPAPERPGTELRRTSETATKNGYPCRKYEIWRDGRKIRELWVTDWSNLEGGDEMSDVWAEMAKFFRELMETIKEGLPGGFGGGIGGSGDDTIFEHMEEIDGFPVVNDGFDEDGSLDDHSELRSARRRRLDPAEFEPPAGYKRRTMGPQ